MGLTFGKILNKKEEVKSTEETSSSILTQEEIQLLLLMIKGTSFKGENIELIYNLIIKLQNQYQDLQGS